MTLASEASDVPAAAPRSGWAKVFDGIATIAGLALRFALAIPFFLSGLTKWAGETFFDKVQSMVALELAPSTQYLFENEFKLNVFGTAYDFPYPEISAYASAFAEIVFPILLVLGLATRFAALGLLGMAVVIFLVYPDTWRAEQLPWAAMALATRRSTRSPVWWP